MTFKTKPRYIGEFAKAEYNARESLKSNPEYTSSAWEAQTCICRIVRIFNRGLITEYEAMKELVNTK